jgi:hypothetical protein
MVSDLRAFNTPSDMQSAFAVLIQVKNGVKGK